MARLLARLRSEDGFGLIELAFAMVMLNIGILALVAAFNSGALSLRRAALTSNATAVADSVMETYRDLKYDAIYLSGSTIPQSGATLYATYHANTAGYTCTTCSSQTTYTYYTSGSPGSWVDQTYSGTNTSDCPVASTGACASMSPINPTYATQSITGPDGQSYTVLSYIVAVPITSGGTVKQVTVSVLDPRNPTHVVVTEQSLFDPSSTS